jgi:hypothetical protein
MCLDSPQSSVPSEFASNDDRGGNGNSGQPSQLTPLPDLSTLTWSADRWAGDTAFPDRPQCRGDGVSENIAGSAVIEQTREIRYRGTEEQSGLRCWPTLTVSIYTIQDEHRALTVPKAQWRTEARKTAVLTTQHGRELHIWQLDFRPQAGDKNTRSDFPSQKYTLNRLRVWEMIRTIGKKYYWYFREFRGDTLLQLDFITKLPICIWKTIPPPWHGSGETRADHVQLCRTYGACGTKSEAKVGIMTLQHLRNMVSNLGWALIRPNAIFKG